MPTATTKTALSNLTPMERALLHRLDDLDQTVSAKLRRQDDRIDALEAEIRGRDAAITRLTGLLSSLLGPAASGGS